MQDNRERRGVECQEETEQDLWDRDPEPEELGEPDAVKAGVEWAVTSRGLDPEETVCALPAEPKHLTSEVPRASS
jgi:hypothetical protein